MLTDCEDIESGACFLVKERPYLCYNDNNKIKCCLTCKQLFTEITGNFFCIAIISQQPYTNNIIFKVYLWQTLILQILCKFFFIEFGNLFDTLPQQVVNMVIAERVVTKEGAPGTIRQTLLAVGPVVVILPHLPPRLLPPLQPPNHHQPQPPPSQQQQWLPR